MDSWCSESCACVTDRWVLNYIVLQQGALSIYAGENDVMPCDIVNLYGSAVVLPVYPKVLVSNVIEVLTPKRSVYLQAGSSQELQEWALAVQKAAILETSGKLIVPPLNHAADKAAAAAVAHINPHALARAEHESKSAGGVGIGGSGSAAAAYNGYGGPPKPV